MKVARIMVKENGGESGGDLVSATNTEKSDAGLATRRRHLALKRMVDTAAVLVTAPLTLPVAAVTAVLVRINMGKPVLYTQERVGFGEGTFPLLKFRSMLPETDTEGRRIPESERLTPFGHLLRRSSLDELPQLLNVLKGDMAIVGPRPLLTTYLPFYRDSERARHSVRPGITGAAQVAGRNYLDWDEQLAFDAEYAREGTLLDDLKIIGKTLAQVLKPSDVGVPGQEGLGWLNEDRSCLSRDGYVLRRLAQRDIPRCVEWLRQSVPGGFTSLPVEQTAESIGRWLEVVADDQSKGVYVLTDRWADEALALVGCHGHDPSELPLVYAASATGGSGGENLGRAVEFLFEHMRLNLGLPGAKVDLAREDREAVEFWKGLSLEEVAAGQHSDRVGLEIIWRSRDVEPGIWPVVEVGSAGESIA